MAVRAKQLVKTALGGVQRDQRGYLLAIVIIIVGTAPLITFSLLNLAGASFQSAAKDTTRIRERYAADTGVVDVFADLVNGVDVLSLSYSVPTPTVNGFPVSISVSGPASGTELTGDYRYIDPGVSFGLSSLTAQTHYYFQMDAVRTGTSIRVNWAFTPEQQRWKLAVYQGLGPPGAPTPTILARDDFESGDFTGGTGDWTGAWSTAGDALVVTSGSPFEGANHAQLRRGTGQIDRVVDLTGQTNVRWQFQAKASSFEAGETATCSVDDGSGLVVVRLWEDGEDDDVYREEDIDLSSFTMSATFTIRCDANMNNVGDLFFLDDLQIVSQVTPVAIATGDAINGPAQIFVTTADVTTGGTYTVDFLNDSGASLVASSFVASGDNSNTWIYAQAYQDQVVTSVAGDATIKAYLRQMPGPTDPDTREEVFIHSWKEP